MYVCMVFFLSPQTIWIERIDDSIMRYDSIRYDTSWLIFVGSKHIQTSRQTDRETLHVSESVGTQP